MAAPEASVWRKASRSNNSGDNCVELASMPAAVAVRDSKNPDGPRVLLRRDGFGRLVRVIKDARVGGA
ncbi:MULTISPECIES: DUF397 domain-containing protein [Actinomadura]|uniref:DUF397 domain-containing protein n=1 Tax=Actinomadura yumaensis TaxID=111807 RepID=A0ABW2CXN2_9ACTN|nr:DUF397 domain-containing protein [Actinomadura sp. J1-007]MWK34195.1 DUF397 domain-containing protein [Actinomadura sp. J1-007]